MLSRRHISRELRTHIGPRLKAMREERGVSQESLALAAGITQASISNYESGRSEVPLSVLLFVCRYFEVPLADAMPVPWQSAIVAHAAGVVSADGAHDD